MVVSVYFFRNDTITPAGETDVSATYDNKLILLGGTPLATGGALVHTHPSGYVDNVSYVGYYVVWFGVPGYYNGIAGHSHFAAGSSVVDAGSSNFPACDNIRILRRDVSGWDGSVPDGTISMYNGTPPINSAWKLHGDTSNLQFVRISPTLGGYSLGEHEHVVTFTTGESDGYHGVESFNYSIYWGVPYLHQHTRSGSMGVSYYDYYYLSMSFVKATGGTQYVKQGMYFLFDGNPGSDWTLDSSGDGKYLKFGNGAKATGGSYQVYIHSHAVSGAVTDWPNTYDFQFDDYTDDDWGTTYYHYHTCDVHLNNATAEPSYVRLLLYYSNKDFTPAGFSSGYSDSTIFFNTTGGEEAMAHCMIWTRLPENNNIYQSLPQQGFALIHTRNTVGDRHIGDLMFCASMDAVIGSYIVQPTIKSYIKRHRGIISVSQRELVGRNLIR